MALTAKQQKKLAGLADKVVAGTPLSAKEQKSFSTLSGSTPKSIMPTVDGPAPTIKNPPPRVGSPSQSGIANMPALTGNGGTKPKVKANGNVVPAGTGGIKPSKGNQGGSQGAGNVRGNQGQAGSGGGGFGPKKQESLARLSGMQQSGAPLSPKQQARLTSLQGDAAAAGGKKGNAALAGPNSVAGQNFEMPKALTDPNIRNVNFDYKPKQVQSQDVRFNYTPQQVSSQNVDYNYTPEQVAAQAPGMEQFNPGNLQDIASSLGLDFGALTKGLSAQDYLANQDPSYQFQQDEARKAIEASAAARGGVLGGGTMKALQDRASQVAALDYQNAYARDMANRQIGLGQVQNQFGNDLAGWSANAGYDVSNRGMDLNAQMANQNAGLQASQYGLQAGLANASNALQAGMANQSAGLDAAGMSLQARLASANNALQAGIANQGAGLDAAGMRLNSRLANVSNDLQARSLAGNNMRAQWDAQMTNRAQNLSALNDTFNRDLAAKNFGLQGIQTAAGLKQQDFNNNMTSLGFAADLLSSNRNSAQNSQGFGLGMLQGNQANQTGLANSWLNNDWTNRNWQTSTLGSLLNTGYGASGTMSNNSINRAGQAQNAASGYGNAAMNGALASGAAWGNAMNGVGNAISGGLDSYMMASYMNSKYPGMFGG
jgi:hypothetical protein